MKYQLDQNQRQLRYTWLFQNLLRFGYYACYVPFKLEVDLTTGLVLIRHNWFQKIICGLSSLSFILHVGIVKIGIVWVYLEERSSQAYNSRAYFLAMESLAYTILISTTTWTLWWKQDKIVRLMKELVKASNLKSIVRSISIYEQDESRGKLSDLTKGRLWLAFIIVVMITLCSLVASTPYIREDGVQSKMGWAEASLYSAKTMFFQSTKSSHEGLHFTDGLFIFFYLLSMCNGFIKDIFGELVFLCGSLTLWILSADWKVLLDEVSKDEIMSCKCEDDNDSLHGMQWKSIYKNYKNLRKISRLVNNISGGAFLTHVLVMLLYLPTRIHLVFAAVNNTLPRVIVFVYFPVEMANLIIAAKLSARVQSLRELVSRRNISLPRRHVVLLTNELEHLQPVSIGGGGGGQVFKVTYHSLGKMLEFVGTYFLTVAASESEANGLNIS